MSGMKLSLTKTNEQERVAVTLTKTDGRGGLVSGPIYINGEDKETCATLAQVWVDANPNNRAEWRESVDKWYKVEPSTKAKT